MFNYTTAESVKYKVYNATEITDKRITSIIKDSDYFETHYVYAKELIKRGERKEKAEKKYRKFSSRKNQRAVMASTRQIHSYVSTIRCGFDIETTRIDEYDDSNKLLSSHAYMYHWQFVINDSIITGRTWTEFYDFMDNFSKSVRKELAKAMNRHGSRYSKKTHPVVIVWVANLPFEFQFIKDLFSIDKIFAKESRKALTVAINSDKNNNYMVSNKEQEKSESFIRFQDCLQITGSTLSNLAKDYTTTQKRKGDLDYEIIRNSKTPLTEEELHYCYDDVAILSEWHDYYVKEYSDKGYAPMTATGILRHEVKKRQTVEDLKKVWDMLPEKKEYKKVMNYLFKGGYSHANATHTGQELNDCVYSWDITSSYPYVMLTKEFPMSQFTGYKRFEDKLNSIKDTDKLHDYIENSGIMFYCDVELIAPESKTNNTYISFSKCMNGTEITAYTNIKAEDNFPVSIIDNGRIMRTYRTLTSETNLDILTILEMYDFEEIIFHDVKVCLKTSALPEYITEPIEEAYITKAELKQQGKSHTINYKLAKSKVNSGYGMMCTRLVADELAYDSEEHKWVSTETDPDLKDQLFLNPMWGVYVTAYARRRLMEIVVKAGDNTCCCDTDSIYCVKTPEIETAIETENQKVLAINHKRFSNPCCHDLGTWDRQSINDKKEFTAYERFVTMGAKRYVLYGWNDKEYGWKQTIAGLPKGVLIDFCKERNLDVMKVFKNMNGLELDRKSSTKKTAFYNDKAHWDYVTDSYGNKEVMSEQSSVSVVPITFRMTIADTYATALNFIKIFERNRKTERRII